jgi:hypothetical protein
VGVIYQNLITLHHQRANHAVLDGVDLTLRSEVESVACDGFANGIVFDYDSRVQYFVGRYLVGGETVTKLNLPL